MSTLQDAIQGVALSVLPVIGVWAASQAKRWMARREYVDSDAMIKTRVKSLVASKQRSVEQLMDPACPGVWDQTNQIRVKREVIEETRALEPLACMVVRDALDGDDRKLDMLIGAYVEQYVRELRVQEAGGIVLPKPSESKVPSAVKPLMEDA
jgi:hypothetical protein